MNIKVLILSAVALTCIGCWSMGADSNAAAANDTPMTETDATKGDFYKSLPKDFEMPTADAGKLLLREYGAVFVARGGVTPPKKVVFRDEADVRAYQATLEMATAKIGGTNVYLQEAAMTALKAAIAEASLNKLSISPRGGTASRRGYDETVTLWASRVNPGFTYWVGKGRVKQAEATRIKSLSPFEQVPEILRLEQDGIFFAKSLDKSIIYSVAPPGTSQHISMLALDVAEFDNARVRSILAQHGWFQTVASDLPHFTYIGVQESELSHLGLKQITNSGRTFWVPAI
ncbi:MAG: hypothetical protein WBO10_17970 [Pyrinomonadaceae bacterium]